MPKWGLSKSEYFFDSEKKVIAKGLSSIKYMSSGLAEEMFEMAHRKKYRSFMDLLCDLNTNSSLKTNQLDILIKIDFFSEFGNQRELLKITELFYDMFKKGQAKQIKKERVDGTPLESIVKKYAVGVTKSGGIAKSYTLLDVMSIMHEAEDAVKELHMDDLSIVVKVRNFAEVMGYEKGRSLLQYVGTDVVRAKNPDYWVDFVSDILNLFDGRWDYVIIPDTRFPNEFNRLKERGFNAVHLRVVRPDFVSQLTEKQQTHQSETALNDITPDYCIYNTGDLKELNNRVTDWLKEKEYAE